MIHPTSVDHQLQGKIYMFPNIHFIPSHANKTSADGDIQINETPNCCRSSVGYNIYILGLHSNDQLVNADSRIAYEGMCGADYSITRHGPSFFICLPGLWLGKIPETRSPNLKNPSPNPKNPNPKNPNLNSGSNPRYPKLLRVVRVLGYGTRITRTTRNQPSPNMFIDCSPAHKTC